jgi:hypothetical protein
MVQYRISISFTNYTGYDPEIGLFNQNPLLNGIDNGNILCKNVFFRGKLRILKKE